MYPKIKYKNKALKFNKNIIELKCLENKLKNFNESFLGAIQSNH